MTRPACIAAALALVIFAGCAAEPQRVGFSAREIADAAPEEILAAARPVLQREFGRLQLDRGRARIVGGPSEYVASSGTGALSDAYRGRTTLRRTATFATAARGGSAVARLRIDVERRDTERPQITQREGSRLSDAPGYSAVETDAATSGSQNEVWTFLRRDTQLETALLAEVQAHFATEPPRERDAPRAGTASGQPPRETPAADPSAEVPAEPDPD